MRRTHTCGELSIDHVGKEVTLCGWVQRIRNKGAMIWVDLRDRYGTTQLVGEEGVTTPEWMEKMKVLGREYVLQVTGTVTKRYAPNPKLPTGDIEIQVQQINVLNPSKPPPFTLENHTDGGEDLRMKYRYLDLRRPQMRDALMLRHRMLQAVRTYLSKREFIEVETPILIKSTPEGARDFIIPSRVNKGTCYALPQSPQTFKQLLMVSGFDRYFQIVKCFRDEDLRADRQPEFTQIDCEMSFVTQQDILDTFEGLIRHIFKQALSVELPPFERMTYSEAMRNYGSDKPDIRWDMPLVSLNKVAQNKGFNVFDRAELVVAICAKGCASYTRKQIDALTNFIRQPQIGAEGLVYVKYNEDGTLKSSVDKFYSPEDLRLWADQAQAQPGDLLLILSGDTQSTRKQISELRLHLGGQLGLRDPKHFKPLWVVDFPLLERDEETQRYHAMHHPFTSPKTEDIPLLNTQPEAVNANAYDLVINGVEIGGGSIRIHDRPTQEMMFKHLGFTPEEAQTQFGFLMDAFEYGAPPHGGIAFGFDRLCAMLGSSESIRDFIAFPKNTSARDVMIDSPSPIAPEQLRELGLQFV